MTDEHGATPTGALEDVAYLSRSTNRIRILDELAKEPKTRRELAEQTGTSRTTLDRIVNELEDRAWVKRTADGDYVATSTGDRLMAQVRPFLDSVRAVRRLEDAVAWLPEDLSIGLHHFADATVRRPAGDDPMATVDYFVDLVQDAAEIRVLTHLAPPAPLALAMRDGLLDGRLTATYVVTDDLVEYLRAQPERRTRWRELVEAGAEVYRYDGHVPCNLFVFGGTVLIKRSRPEPIHDSYGAPIESEDEAVRSWARDLVERHRADATPVGVEAFADEPVVRQIESADRSGAESPDG